MVGCGVAQVRQARWGLPLMGVEAWMPPRPPQVGPVRAATWGRCLYSICIVPYLPSPEVRTPTWGGVQAPWRFGDAAWLAEG